MTKSAWQITKPFDAIVFDCDGTLSTIEGIDYLAELNKVADKVSQLTEIAMAKTGLTPEIYEQRLTFVKPSFTDLIALGNAYCQHAMPEIKTIIQLLHQQHKAIFILSAGIKQSVMMLANYLNIPEKNTHAVEVYLQNNHYHDFDRQSPLIHNDGKRNFIQIIKKNYPRILYVGDGLNDLAVKNDVSRFVGFGGAFYRQNIADASDFYITDYKALLPLVLTAQEAQSLSAINNDLYLKGLNLLNGN